MSILYRLNLFRLFIFPGGSVMKKTLFILTGLILILLLMSCAFNDTKQTSAVPGAAKEQAFTITGIYQGLADNNTYEVQLSENTYKMLVITQEVREDFEKLNLKKGDKIEVTYIKGPASALQTISIRLVGSEENKDRDKVTGKYIGLADNNFFEVLIDNPAKQEYKVFMITEAVRSVFERLDLQKNDPVNIYYSANDAGQLEVMNIERLKQP